MRRRRRAGQVDLGGRGGRLADPDRVAVGLDLVVGPAGLDALRVVLGVPARLTAASSFLWISSHCSPSSSSNAVVGARARPAAGADDREPALHLLAVEAELELAVADGLAAVERRRLGLPGAPVPDDDVAGAVLLGGMTPSKSKYSIGWSSTWTAMRRILGSRVGPLGTAQLTRTPSISRRKS